MKAYEVMQKIKSGGFKLNAYSQVYFNAFPDLELEYGEYGVKTQILYFFSNCKALTPLQKEIKTELLAYAKKS